MPCLPKLNYIYKLICQINKRSLLGLQQEIAYYLKGTFQIQWETSAAFWREESSLLILLLMVIPQNYKLQHRARMKLTSFFLCFIYQGYTLHFEYPHKLLTIALKFFLYMVFNHNLGAFYLDGCKGKKWNKESHMVALNTDNKFGCLSSKWGNQNFCIELHFTEITCKNISPQLVMSIRAASIILCIINVIKAL